jgi:glucans biosynthesis protein
MGKNPIPRRLRAIRGWAGPISGDILPSRPVLPESGQDACRQWGTSRQIVYEQSYFDMPADSPGRELPKGAGFAGLRIQEARDGTLDWRKNDWVAFLGAAYFRSIGELAQYGLSSRGVAIDVAVADRPEEFPDFTEFYIEPAVGDAITLYALMEGPSIVGAFRFLMSRAKGVVMDLQTTLFTRAQVSRFGIAPLTSMYWYSETKKETAIDWRPEVHDSMVWRCGPAAASDWRR